MGYGSYSHQAHEAIVRKRKSVPRERIFRQRRVHPLMDPHGVRYIESRDSDAHPHSLAVVFALDVTGSMGQIAEQLARQDLPTFMQTLLDVRIQDPQVLFVGIGDANGDAAPLQVGQFESEAEPMDAWLTRLYLEGGGGGQGAESYELALYFLSRHVYMDCWIKRRKRGYLFLAGDELPYPWVSRLQADQIIGDELEDDIRVEDVVDEIQKSFEPFFLIPGLDRRRACERGWRDLLGDRVLVVEDIRDMAKVAAALVALTEGTWDNLDALADYYSRAGLERDAVGRIVRAVTPYAASIDRDGAPKPAVESAGIE